MLGDPAKLRNAPMTTTDPPAHPNGHLKSARFDGPNTRAMRAMAGATD